MTDEFRTTVRIAATPEQVFPYLVEPDQLIRWMSTDAIVDPRPGGRYDLVVNGLGISGHVEVYDPPKRLVVTWGYIDSPDLPPGASTVEITLTPDSTDTIVELTHRGLTSRQARDHRAGWLHGLERLRITAARRRSRPRHPTSETQRRRPTALICTSDSAGRACRPAAPCGETHACGPADRARPAACSVHRTDAEMSLGSHRRVSGPRR